ncbi:MAG: hypothetical protein A2Y00_08620 [Omnitrophica WOR_2 bacterium GWF2_43_52]|nr:MAG: hypothetical protein A2Y00_08620 [Omnitrophica WOR_2 bacterium GWF2_43_52]OGX53909.1 MAG: hypothetical protein A2460_07430 [Omnitrophica WOR_2 bacterium RIFOXYC2_FULL_43_9]HAH20340.1 hypothetical protein [Candidatus Omnitrophota bacterium]HBG62887.1 hypothetical protein [Candidatus Omnitrophota bacterium]
MAGAMARKLNKGFTLPELLLAFSVMALVLAGALSLFISCIFLNETNRNLSVATGHAQLVLEEIKNTNFVSMQSGAINPETNWDWDNAAISAKGLIVLNTESISTQAVWTGTDRLNVNVTVSWKDRGLRDRSTSLETLITEP